LYLAVDARTGRRETRAFPFDLFRRASSRRTGILVALALASGCYQYLPRTSTADLTGKRVLVTLTDSGAVVLAPMVGPSIEALAGTLSSDSLASYTVLVTMVRHRNGVESDWSGEAVHVHRSLIARMEERQLAKARTTLGSVALAAMLVIAERAFGGGGGATVPGPGSGGPGGPR
jgi:hypothetical protein